MEHANKYIKNIYTHVHADYIYLNTYVHTHIHTYIHTYIHTHTYICTYIHIRTYIHMYIHTYVHTYNLATYSRSILSCTCRHISSSLSWRSESVFLSQNCREDRFYTLTVAMFSMQLRFTKLRILHSTRAVLQCPTVWSSTDCTAVSNCLVFILHFTFPIL